MRWSRGSMGGLSREQLPLPYPSSLTKPKARHGCRRDPEAGPGTCWHWGERCPNGEKRGCYMLWVKAQAVSANKRLIKPPPSGVPFESSQDD